MPNGTYERIKKIYDTLPLSSRNFSKVNVKYFRKWANLVIATYPLIVVDEDTLVSCLPLLTT